MRLVIAKNTINYVLNTTLISHFEANHFLTFCELHKSGNGKGALLYVYGHQHKDHKPKCEQAQAKAHQKVYSSIFTVDHTSGLLYCILLYSYVWVDCCIQGCFTLWRY